MRRPGAPAPVLPVPTTVTVRVTVFVDPQPAATSRRQAVPASATRCTLRVYACLPRTSACRFLLALHELGKRWLCSSECVHSFRRRDASIPSGQMRTQGAHL